MQIKLKFFYVNFFEPVYTCSQIMRLILLIFSFPVVRCFDE